MNKDMMKKKIKLKDVSKKKWEVHQLFGVPIDALTIENLHEYILELVKSNGHEYVLNVNINCLNLVNSKPKLKEMFRTSKLTFLDGDGVRLALRISGRKSPQKITYARWINKFARYSEMNNISWYLLGDTNATVNKAKENLLFDFPNLNITGTHHGYFNMHESESIINNIKVCKPDVLIIAMGMPRQEFWLMNNWSEIPDVNCALTGGAVLKYLSGEAKKTPSFFYNLKLEWFYRFINEPRRLFKRYFIGNALFFMSLFLCKIGVKKYK